MTKIMRQVRATTMQRRLAAETLAKALEAVEMEKEPAERIVKTAIRLHQKKEHFAPPVAKLATAR